MNKDAIDETATIMNKIRFICAEKNNNIYNCIKPNISCDIFKPTITKDFVNKVNTGITDMKINACSNIENKLMEFIARNDMCESSSPNSKTRRFSKDISTLLEQSFCYNMYPTEDEKLALAQRCRISLKQVSNWFTNKRNRTKTIRGRRSY